MCVCVVSCFEVQSSVKYFVCVCVPLVRGCVFACALVLVCLRVFVCVGLSVVVL